MQIGALIAFLSYLMQILMSVMMATFMADDGPARRGVRRAHRRGARHRVVGRRRRRTPVTAAPRARRARAARRRVPLPGRRRAGAARHRRCTAPRRADHRDHRQHRRRQDHAARPDPAAVRRHRAARCCRRRRRARARPGGALAPDRAGAAEAVPVLRHGRQQPALRQPGRHRRRAVGRRWRSPRPRDFVAAMPGGLDAPIAQGGTNVSGGQRQRLAIARALVRKPGDLPVRRLVLGARPRHRRPAAGRAAPGHRATPRWSIVAQRVSTIVDADQILVLEDGAVVGLGTPRRAARRAARPTPRSSRPSSAPEAAA